jgi:hypothetical protein
MRAASLGGALTLNGNWHKSEAGRLSFAIKNYGVKPGEYRLKYRLQRFSNSHAAKLLPHLHVRWKAT